MALVKAIDLIATALRRLNIVNVGDPIEDADAQTGLAALADLIESWSIDRLAVYTIASAAYPLTPAKASYTIGIDPSGQLTADIPAPRPSKIESANLLIGNISYNLHLANDSEWADRGLRSFSAVPDMLYNDGSNPLSTLSLYPGPSDSGWQLELFTWQALSQFADLATAYQFPPAYARALKHNLAVELAPEYDREPSPTLLRLAAESKAAIENLNITPVEHQSDPALLSARRGRTQMGWIGNYR